MPVPTCAGMNESGSERPARPVIDRRLPVWTRKVPINAVALVAIAVFVLATHVRYALHGMCFHDPSWYFHFGNSTLHGAVPYRDYIFQVGPLPIYVDAGFQGVFGETYA